jgi:RND family efflux transporter MFP subunit
MSAQGGRFQRFAVPGTAWASRTVHTRAQARRSRVTSLPTGASPDVHFRSIAAPELQERFGFEPERVVAVAHGLLSKLAGPTAIPTPMQRRPLLALVLAALAASCRGEGAKPPVGKIAVSPPLQREVVDWDEYTGRMAAVQSVEIRARVSGYLESLHFTDGQVVGAGDLLFVIDPRPYRATLEGAKADLAQQESRLELARNEAERARRLVARNAISQEEFESRTSVLHNSEAAVQAARAAVESARLNVEFTEIRSPLRGRIGHHLVDVGNLVNGGTTQSTLLTTVVSLDPIHCYFEADERSYLKYTDLAKSGVRPSSRDVPNPVVLELADEKGFPHRGHMDFVDNQLDPTTGTIRGRAIFPNPDLKLTPGLFARVRLLGRGRYQALLLPDGAIGTDQSERFVLVLSPQNVVERHPVKVGRLVEGFRVIESGVSASDSVIVSGLQGVRVGQTFEADAQPIQAPERFASLDLLEPEAPAAVGAGEPNATK